MVQASVGFHCPECVKASSKTAPVLDARTLIHKRAQPIVTYALIAVNIAMFLGEYSGGSITRDGGLADKGYTVAVTVNASETAINGGVAYGEVYRLISGGFLHGSILHIAMNMYCLWVLGQLIEPALGRLRFGALYFTCLLAGSFGVMLTAPVGGALGASGAIFGLFGITFMLMRSRGINPFQTGLATVLMINLVITFVVPGISIGGHIGGLLGGFVAGYVVLELEKRRTPEWLPLLACAGMSALFIIGAIWAAGSWAHPIIPIGH